MAYNSIAMANMDLRQKMRSEGVTFWQLADVLGVCEMTVSRRFRKELSEKEKNKISGIIDRLAAERKESEKNE